MTSSGPGGNSQGGKLLEGKFPAASRNWRPGEATEASAHELAWLGGQRLRKLGVKQGKEGGLTKFLKGL